MADSESLFDRIGGEEAVAGLIEAFYDRVLRDELLAPFFEHASMEKLRRMQREFFAAALGGPIHYSGQPLATVHARMGIRPKHLARFLEHLLDTLNDKALDEAEVYEIYSRINTYADEITGDTTVDG